MAHSGRTDIETLADRVVRELAALPERKMRTAAIASKVSSMPVDEAARLIDAIYGIRSRDASAARSALLDHERLAELLGARRYDALRREFDRLGLRKAARLFSDSPPRRVGVAGYDKEEEARMEHVQLGRRRSMAKSPVKDILDRLLSDPDARVVAGILDNPRITEKEVLKMASKRPNSAAILKLIAGHARWSGRYAVKKALAMNPYSPPRLSTALLESLMKQDLEAIASDGTVHQEVRISAAELLRQRATG